MRLCIQLRHLLCIWSNIPYSTVYSMIQDFNKLLGIRERERQSTETLADLEFSQQLHVKVKKHRGQIESQSMP